MKKLGTTSSRLFAPGERAKQVARRRKRRSGRWERQEEGGGKVGITEMQEVWLESMVVGVTQVRKRDNKGLMIGTPTYTHSSPNPHNPPFLPHPKTS